MDSRTSNNFCKFAGKKGNTKLVEDICLIVTFFAVYITFLFCIKQIPKRLGMKEEEDIFEATFVG